MAPMTSLEVPDSSGRRGRLRGPRQARSSGRQCSPANITVRCQIPSCQIVSCQIISCQIISCQIISCQIISCLIIKCSPTTITVSWHAITWQVISCYIFRSIIISPAVLSYNISAVGFKNSFCWMLSKNWSEEYLPKVPLLTFAYCEHDALCYWMIRMHLFNLRALTLQGLANMINII